MGLMESQRKCLKVLHSALPHLLLNLNISIRQGHFPECWKASSLEPGPKSTGLSNVTNYRPISLLSIVSEILERHFHQYITNHLNEYHPLSNKQWGFQSGKSTTTALLSVTHDWFQALEARQEVCSIFFHIRKAFEGGIRPPLSYSCPLLEFQILKFFYEFMMYNSLFTII